MTACTNHSCFSLKHARHRKRLVAQCRQWDGWQQSVITQRKKEREAHEAAEVAKVWSQYRQGWAAAVCPHVQLPSRSRLVTPLLSQDLVPLTVGPKYTEIDTYTRPSSLSIYLSIYWCTYKDVHNTKMVLCDTHSPRMQRTVMHIDNC